MNSVLSQITKWSLIFGILLLAAVAIGVDYHILWIGEFRGIYFDAAKWELWKKVLIFIAEIIVFAGCVIACIVLFIELLDEDIEADGTNFGRSLLALIFCGVLPGVLWWISMIQYAISQAIYSSRSSRGGSSTAYRTTTDDSGDEDEESDEEEVDDDDDTPKKTTRVIKFREKDDSGDDSGSPTPRRKLKRRGE